MTLKRLYHSFRMSMCRGSRRRAEYAKKHHIFAGIGENVSIMGRVIPLYSELIRFHNNIAVASNVTFCTHDEIRLVLNRIPGENNRFSEHIGCIEIMDNVFIGTNSTILYGVRIGPNALVASGSVVTKDVEPNSVVAGVPARRIGSLEDYKQKLMKHCSDGTMAFTSHNQHLTDEEITNAWRVFNIQHSDV